jgi:hypothetical protein
MGWNVHFRTWSRLCGFWIIVRSGFCVRDGEAHLEPFYSQRNPFCDVFAIVGS